MSESGDYISRELAIKARGRSCDMDCAKCDFAIEGDSWCNGEVFVVDLLRIPAADVRPVVRGKWEDVEVTYVADKTTLPFERISSMRCNQCNRYHTEIYYYGNPTEMAHYCPNCGADMREES